MGCSILYNLADQGLTGHPPAGGAMFWASGSTSKSQAILRIALLTNEVTSSLAWQSLEIFKNFEELTGTPSGYIRTRLFPDSWQRRQAGNVRERSYAPGDSASPAKSSRLRTCASSLPCSLSRGDEYFAYEPESGYADPYSVTLGFATRAREMGAQIQDGTPVTGIEISGGKVSAVLTDDDRIETDIAVVAAGPWSDRLLTGVGVDVPIRPLRHQVVVLRRPPGPDADHPIVADNLNGFSARPDIGGLTMIGAGEEEYVDADTFNQGVDMDVVQPAFEGIVSRIPAMSRAVFRGGWSGAFTVTPDWHPVLDRIEGIDGLYCAVGFSGHGFKESPMIGKAMAELITKGRAECVDISMLNLKRFETGELLRSRYAMQVLA